MENFERNSSEKVVGYQDPFTEKTDEYKVG
jgi:hypothetical protein